MYIRDRVIMRTNIAGRSMIVFSFCRRLNIKRTSMMRLCGEALLYVNRLISKPTTFYGN